MTSDESMVRYPVEVNVVINEPVDRPDTIYTVHETALCDQQERSKTVAALTESQTAAKKPKSTKSGNKKHHRYRYRYTGDKQEEDNGTVIKSCEQGTGYASDIGIERRKSAETTTYKYFAGHTQEDENVIIDLDCAASAWGNDDQSCNTSDSEIADQIDNKTAIEGNEQAPLTRDVELLITEDSIKVKNETINKFLKELHDKKLELRSNFSEQEIDDIHSAVHQHIERLAKTIGEQDSRLKIQEIIKVGSAREYTQIIRPCEFDYILVLEELSRSGAVSITPAVPKAKTEPYMLIKLEDDETRTMFQELSDDDNYLRASHWLPYFRRGLRDVFSSALNEAVMMNSGTPVKMTTGQLRMKHLKTEPHGIAILARFVWERNGENNATMEVSVDICPALKLDATDHENIMQSFDQSIFTDLGYTDNLETVLLMPRIQNLFKVTFTESEIACTSNLSQHHKTCYKLLKRLVNGEPQPPERPADCVMKHFQGPQTIFHSYILKTKIWNHHFKQHCTEQEDIYGCVNRVLYELKKLDKELPKHPFARISIRDSDVFTESAFVERLSISRLNTLSKGLKQIKTTPIEKYNFEDFCRVIGNNKFPAKCVCKAIDNVISIVLFTFLVNLLVQTYFAYENLPLFVSGSVLLLCYSLLLIALSLCPALLSAFATTLSRYSNARIDSKCIVIFYVTIGIALLYTGLMCILSSTPEHFAKWIILLILNGCYILGLLIEPVLVQFYCVKLLSPFLFFFFFFFFFFLHFETESQLRVSEAEGEVRRL